VKEVEVAVAATQIDLTGLDGDTDKVYRLFIDIEKVTTPGVAIIAARLNNDSGANYTSELLEVSGGAFPSSRNLAQTELRLGGSTTQLTRITADAVLYVESGSIRRGVSQFSGEEGPGISLDYEVGDWSNTVDNVTQINILTGVANDIGAGSKVWLFRPVMS
jgi:hypothetical protein